MAEDPYLKELRTVADWFPESSWPSLTCPNCGRGELVVEDITVVQTEESQRLQRQPFAGSDDVFGYFYGLLRCSRGVCNEGVVASGEMMLGPANEAGTGLGECLLLVHALPSLRMIAYPEECPQPVVDRVNEAAGLILRDANAAANRIRVAIEELLTAERVRRFTQGSRRRRLPTQERIKLFRERNPEAARFLEAVKWIGNSGSHESALQVHEVLDGVELFTHALHIIYDRRTEKLSKLADKIKSQQGNKTTSSARRKASILIHQKLLR
jgi:hypothetical protein